MSNPGPIQRRQEQRRLERVADYQRQIRDGSLRVWKMSKAEREYWGPVKDPAAAKKRARQREIAKAKRA